MKWKRIRLVHLRAYDLEKGESIVREIEMTVDYVLRDSGYALQFWRDVEVYGLEEAYLYLCNSGQHSREDDDPELDELIKKTCVKLREWLPTSRFSPTL